MLAKTLLPAAAVAALGLLASQSTGTVTVNTALLQSVLKELDQPNESLKEEDGTTTLVMGINDVSVQLYQFPDSKGTDSLKLNAGWDFDKGPSLQAVNEFNSKHRFARAYLDAEGDPFLVSDLDLKGPVSRDAIKNFILRYRLLVPLFVKEVLNGKSQQN